MQKRIFLIACLLIAGFSFTHAQNQDPIIMTIGNVSVPRSEFEYNFNKNNNDNVIDKKSIAEYVDLFAAYKLKVLYALDAKMDTASSFLHEFHKYRDQQIRPMLVPEAAVETECRNYYDRMLESLGGKELLLPAHIFVRVSQQSSDNELNKAKTLIDSLSGVLKQGADFANMARRYSQDQQSAPRGGSLSWIGPGNTLKEFEDVAYSLQVGQISDPFLSAAGYHIIKLIDRKNLEPFDTLHNQIHQFLENRGVREHLAKQTLDSLSQKYQGRYSVDDILDRETERLCSEDQNLKYLIKEYYEGLLVYDVCSNLIWEPSKKDTVALVNYFKQHKKEYAWKEPHFSGMIYYCQNQDDVNKVKKLLKKVPEDKWISVIREKFNKDSVTVRMERRLFKKGDNQNVDVQAFKVKGVSPKPMLKFPYSGIVGKVLKSGPAKWTDVGSQVVQDLQAERDRKFVEELKKKFPVVVDEKVLTTVNNH